MARRFASGAPLVLVVDDDPEVAGLVSDVLVSEGVPVVTAANGVEAWLAKPFGVDELLDAVRARLPPGGTRSAARWRMRRRGVR